MSHTPIPWALWGKADPSQVIASADAFVAQTVGGNDIANAAFIVRAVNNHDRLVEALRTVRDFPIPQQDNMVAANMREIASAVLKSMEQS